MPTPVTAPIRLLDHGAHVQGVEAIGTLQVGCAGAARIDGDDAELLAQPLDERLKHLEAVDHGIDEQQRLLAGAVQIVGDASVVAQREAGAVPLASMRRRSSCRSQRARGVVALVGGLSSPIRLCRSPSSSARAHLGAASLADLPGLCANSSAVA